MTGLTRIKKLFRGSWLRCHNQRFDEQRNRWRPYGFYG